VQIKVQTNFYCNKIWKCKHKRNKTRLQNKIIPQTNVEQTKHNEGFYFYLYPFKTMWKNFHDDFHMSINQITFLKTFLILNEVWID